MTHEFTDERGIVQHAVATFATYRHRVPSKAALDLSQTSCEHFPGSIEQADVIADLFSHFHLVRREDDRFTGTFEVEHDLFQQFDVDRIETGERLVEDQQIGIVNHSTDELDLLLHSFR